MKQGANPKTGIRLSDRQRLNWLRLIRTDNIGAVTFRDLILFCGSASNALEMLPDLNIRGGSARPIRIISVDEAERELEAIERMGARLIGMGEPEYPPQLKIAKRRPHWSSSRAIRACFANRLLPSSARAMRLWSARALPKSWRTILAAKAFALFPASRAASTRLPTRQACPPERPLCWRAD